MAQNRYTPNYDKRLRGDTGEIVPDHNVLLCVEKRDDKETRHKLFPIAKGSFKLKSVENDLNAVLIIRPDNAVENVSRCSFSLAPDGRSDDDLHQVTLPITIE